LWAGPDLSECRVIVNLTEIDRSHLGHEVWVELSEGHVGVRQQVKKRQRRPVSRVLSGHC